MADLSQIAYLGFDIDSSPARTAAGDLDKLTASAYKTERSAKSLTAASRNLLRDEKGKFIDAYQSAAKYAAEIDNLRMKYNPFYAASVQMEAQQVEIKRALELGAISANQAEAALEKLQRQYITTAGSTSTFGAAVDDMGANVQKGSHHATNLMFQFQDIGMMLAAGQSPLMLAMQQGSQVSGIFAQMGESGKSVKGVFSTVSQAVMGMVSPMSLLTLGVIAGGAALVQWGMSAFGAESNAKTFKEQLDDVQGSIDALRSSTDFTLSSLDQLEEKFGNNATKAREVYAVLSQLQALEAWNALSESAQAVSTELEGLISLMAVINSPQATGSQGELIMRRYLRELNNEFGITRAQGQNVLDLMNKLQNAQGPGEAAEYARQLASALMDAKDETGKAIPEIQKLATSLLQASLKAYGLEDAIDDAKKATDELSASGPSDGWLNGSIGQAQSLATALWDAAAARVAAQGGEWSPSTGLPEGANRPPPRAPAELGIPDPDNGGGGKGGGGGDDFKSRLESLVDNLMTERETVDKWYNENLEILQDRRAQEILGEQGHKDALLDLEHEYLKRKRELNDEYGDFTLGSADKLFGELYQLSGSKYDGLLRVQKTFAAASALINTYTAAAQALAAPEVPFFAKFAAVAKVVAAGMGLVNAIKGGGSGGAGGGLANTSATSQTRAEPERVVRVDLQGDGWLVNLADELMTQIYNETKNGRVVVARA